MLPSSTKHIHIHQKKMHRPIHKRTIKNTAWYNLISIASVNRINAALINALQFIRRTSTNIRNRILIVFDSGCLCTRTKSNKSSRASQRAPIHLKFFYVAEENKKLYAWRRRTSSVATAILPESIPSSLVGFQSAISLGRLVATASNIRYNDM